MAQYQVISDSCSDYTDQEDLSFIRRVPLTIHLDDCLYVDDEKLDCQALVQTMAATSSAPKSACPSPGAWEEAFEAADGDIYVTQQVFSRMLNTGIQYFPVDSMQTSAQEYFASQSANSRSPLENEEKRACLYSARPSASVIPIQA